MNKMMIRIIHSFAVCFVIVILAGCSKPLHDAIDQGRETKFQRLLDKGADVNEVNFYGDTPLHRAAYDNRPGMARILLEHGANKDALNANGLMPLDVAIMEGNEEMVAVLTKYNAGGCMCSGHKEESVSVFDIMDKDRDGEISEMEFLISTLPVIQAQYNRLDTDKSGGLTEGEISVTSSQ